MRILITEPRGFSTGALKLLREAGFRPDPHQGELAEVSSAVGEYEGMIVRFGLRWDRSLLGLAKRLRFIATTTTGTDHIDGREAAAKGIRVISLAGLPGLEGITSTAEHAIGLLLCLTRHTIGAHLSVLEGTWDRDRFVGMELQNKVAGVIGLGRLGKAFSRLAEAFGMEVVYFDPGVTDSAHTHCASLKELASRSDVISVHVTLTTETEGMLGHPFFSACKPGAYLVNTSRGALIDETALLEALENGRLAGAALDVLRDEPVTGKDFLSPVVEYARHHSNVIITPHIGGASGDAMRAAEEIIAGEIIRRIAPSNPG